MTLHFDEDAVIVEDVGGASGAAPPLVWGRRDVAGRLPSVCCGALSAAIVRHGQCPDTSGGTLASRSAVTRHPARWMVDIVVAVRGLLS